MVVRQNAYYLRRFSVPRVLRYPAGIDRGCLVISGFGHHLGLTDTLASMSCWYRSDAGQDEYRLSQAAFGEFQKYEVMTMSVVGDQSKKKNAQIPIIKQKKHTFFLISDYY